MESTGRTRVVGAFLLFAVIMGVGYLYYWNQLDTAISELEISFDGVEVKGFRLLPSPEANITLTYVANNTHNMDFTVTMDGELYYGDSFITPLTVKKSRIRGDGLSTFQMDVTITGGILNTIDPKNKEQYIVQGELVAEKRVLGIPIRVKKPLSNFMLRTRGGQ
ncbi:MAG: hypothetical protein ACLFVP_07065 [Candidatus Bathyarchaeia archaeon]